MNVQHPGHEDLLESLLTNGASRVMTMLNEPASLATGRQNDSDDLTEIARLEQSVMAEDQLVAVGLRLAVSRAGRSDVADHLTSYFANSATSLEIEVERRNVWQMNRTVSMRADEAKEAVDRIEQEILARGLSRAQELQSWAVLHADLWSDPRIGACSRVRGVMLAMVSLLHERSVHLGARNAAN